MELELVRIELPGDTYAMAYKEVLRKTARLHKAALRKYMTPVDAASTRALFSELEAAPQASRKIDYVIDLEAMEAGQDAIDEIYILNQVAEWSFGPITLDTLENGITGPQYTQLVKELNRLYQPNPLPEPG